MYICVCKGKIESDFIKEFNNGSTIKEVIKKFDCTQCKLCKPYIIELYKKNK